MLNIKHPFPKNKGFSILEFLIGFALLSILMSLVFTILFTTMGTTIIAEKKDEILLHGRYILEYLNEEVRSSDLIISTEKIDDLDQLYPDNIGFVIMKDSGVVNSNQRYNFTTFYLNNNRIIRISINQQSIKYPKARDLKGYNEIGEYVLSLTKSSVDFENQLLYINLLMGMNLEDSYEFKSTIFLYTKLDY